MLLPRGSSSTPPEHTTIAAVYAPFVYLRGHSLSSVACEAIFQGPVPNHASPQHQTEASLTLAGHSLLTHPQELRYQKRTHLIPTTVQQCHKLQKYIIGAPWKNTLTLKNITINRSVDCTCRYQLISTSLQSISNYARKKRLF